MKLLSTNIITSKMIAHGIKWTRLVVRIHRTFSSSARVFSEKPLYRQTKVTGPSYNKQTESIKSPPKNFETIEARNIEPEYGTYGSLGEEISGIKIDRQAMIVKLNEFYQSDSIRDLAASHLIHDKLFAKAFISFRKYCYKSTSLPPELHVKFCDIIAGHGHVSDLFPFFLSHARSAFPHLECQEELRKISNLTLPHNWYPEARAKRRKIIFHSGPTNSGKTYHALNRFLQAKSGVYCGPLKLLAAEIYQKANSNNVPCDLVTGEERKFANPDGETKSSHVSCTVEMTLINEPVEVAVIDEIQMVRDPGRGWAWTRALLGIPADEVHLCGEEAALDLVRRMIEPTLDTLEVTRYQRLTPLKIEEKPLSDLKNARPGDCIVCFNKESIYAVSMELEKLGHQVAVVYGTLPPGAKIAQCKKFNEQDGCQVMVATDAIGMGLNLSIARVIFFTLVKSTSDERGNRSQEYLTTSQCLQIAGRAGRFKTAHPTGYVTTLRAEDLRQLREIMSRGVPPIERAGLHPTAEQIELFAFHLPHLSLSNLIEIFISMCEVDADAYFICDLENFKLLANTIQHIDIPLRSRFVFCCAPINTKFPFAVAMFTKFVRQYGNGEPITAEWLRRNLSWPLKTPKNIEELTHLESVFDVFELYLWLSYRFQDIFMDPDGVRELQSELDQLIYSSVSNIVRLYKAKRPKQMLSASNSK